CFLETSEPPSTQSSTRRRCTSLGGLPRTDQRPRQLHGDENSGIRSWRTLSSRGYRAQTSQAGNASQHSILTGPRPRQITASASGTLLQELNGTSAQHTLWLVSVLALVAVLGLV